MYNIQLKQGCVLADGDAHKLGLVDDINTNQRVVVISHPCDLLSEKEEFIEIIVGTVITQSEPQFENARNSRQLHLCYLTKENECMHIELLQSNKRQIDKKEFSECIGDSPYVLVPHENEKCILKQWLVARYGRPALPNAFEERLRKKIGKKNVIKRIEQILENYSQHLVGLFFDLGKDRF